LGPTSNHSFSLAGAKHIIAAHASDVVHVPFLKGITDIDTPEEYRQPQRAMLSHNLWHQGQTEFP